MKEILLGLGGALYGVGFFCLIGSFQAQDAINPVLIMEVLRPMAFYWLFGVITIIGVGVLVVGIQKDTY